MHSVPYQLLLPTKVLLQQIFEHLWHQHLVPRRKKKEHIKKFKENCQEIHTSPSPIWQENFTSCCTCANDLTTVKAVPQYYLLHTTCSCHQLSKFQADQTRVFGNIN